MSHFTTYFPRTIKRNGIVREWVPELSCYIGNFKLAGEKAKELRAKYPRDTVLRFGGSVNVYS